jgi:hypothetical protein
VRYEELARQDLIAARRRVHEQRTAANLDADADTLEAVGSVDGHYTRHVVATLVENVVGQTALSHVTSLWRLAAEAKRRTAVQSARSSRLTAEQQATMEQDAAVSRVEHQFRRGTASLETLERMNEVRRPLRPATCLFDWDLPM